LKAPCCWTCSLERHKRRHRIHSGSRHRRALGHQFSTRAQFPQFLDDPPPVVAVGKLMAGDSLREPLVDFGEDFIR
jgi:hypothetical protein